MWIKDLLNNWVFKAFIARVCIFMDCVTGTGVTVSHRQHLAYISIWFAKTKLLLFEKLMNMSYDMIDIQLVPLRPVLNEH